jgi:hypothetical protein
MTRSNALAADASRPESPRDEPLSSARQAIPQERSTLEPRAKSIRVGGCHDPALIRLPSRRDACDGGDGGGVLGPPHGEEFGQRRDGFPPLLNAQGDDLMGGDR